MNKHLIKSVRALAEAQSARGGQGVIVFPSDLSFPALLAALERAERIEAEASKNVHTLYDLLVESGASTKQYDYNTRKKLAIERAMKFCAALSEPQ